MLKNLKLIKFNNLPKNIASVCPYTQAYLLNNTKSLPNACNNHVRMFGVQAQPKVNCVY